MSSARMIYPRSMLFVPGANARAVEKAPSLQVGAIIYDLEDSVTDDLRQTARRRVEDAVSRAHATQTVAVRVNSTGTSEQKEDLDSVLNAGVSDIVVPKVGSPQDLAHLSSGFNLWPMIETPKGVLNCVEIAGAPGVSGLLLGPNDLRRNLGVAKSADRAELMLSLQMTVLAARAAGIAAIDGVYNAFNDAHGFRAEAEQGRALGFHGKTLIHPSQIAPTEEIFGPAADELLAAQRIVNAYERARRHGLAVASLDGEMIEELHYKQAKQLLGAT